MEQFSPSSSDPRHLMPDFSKSYSRKSTKLSLKQQNPWEQALGQSSGKCCFPSLFRHLFQALQSRRSCSSVQPQSPVSSVQADWVTLHTWSVSQETRVTSHWL